MHAQTDNATGILVLPKLSIDGKAKMTSILAGEIVGVEPASMQWQGKHYDGAKCYTVHGSSFKVFANPVAVVQGWHIARNDATACLTMDACTEFLPNYTDKVAGLLGPAK